ncbi:MAG: glucose 1-dehydrogenase [Geminicoccaceae bacterium]|nr:glucose 1-dehydrogenase [Geminicoccaceae bacterium]
MDRLGKFRLDGKVAVVTGAASGIGLEVCRALGSAGAEVVLLDRDAAGLAAAAEGLASQGTICSTQEADVTDPAAMTGAADAVAAGRGRVDVLVNSAGIARLHTALDAADDEWRHVLDVNLNGTFWACRAFGRHMVAQGAGSIVNLGSMSGIIVNRPQHAASYVASKGAVHMLTKALAAEWAGSGVRVNALAPGYVATEMTLKMRGRPELFETWTDMTPMGRCGEPEEIALAALYLASPAAGYVTGAVLSIDGGYTVW